MMAQQTAKGVTVNSGEFARILRLWNAKGSFEAMEFRGNTEDGRRELIADYASDDLILSMRSRWAIPNEPENGLVIATNESQRLLDYVGGLFGVEEPLNISVENNFIHVDGKTTRAKFPSVDGEHVPKITMNNPYGFGPDGAEVLSNPDMRGPASDWASWTARGYSVASIPTAELLRVLNAAQLVHKRYKSAIIKFVLDGTDSSVRVNIQAAMDNTSDSVELTELAGAMVIPFNGGKNENPYPRISAFNHEIIERLISSWRETTATHITMVSHRSEPMSSFILKEPESGLNLTCVVAQWMEP